MSGIQPSPASSEITRSPSTVPKPLVSQVSMKREAEPLLQAADDVEHAADPEAVDHEVGRQLVSPERIAEGR